jgi:hypothetical protein
MHHFLSQQTTKILFQSRQNVIRMFMLSCCFFRYLTCVYVWTRQFARERATTAHSCVRFQREQFVIA